MRISDWSSDVCSSDLSDGRLDGAAEEHAAELLAALHGIAGPAFCHERDTLIGPLPQPNPWTPSWRDFFREHRLLHMGHLALDSGRSEEHTSELQSLMRISYAVFCLKKKNKLHQI